MSVWSGLKQLLGITSPSINAFEHELIRIKMYHTGSGNGDDFSGYRWVCSCSSMSPAAPQRWFPTEASAMLDYRDHQTLYNPEP